MSIKIRWYDADQTIIFQTLSGTVSNDEFFSSVTAIVDMMQSVSHPVYLVTTAEENLKPPSDVISIMEKAIKTTLAHPNAAQIIPIGNIFLSFMMTVLIRLRGLQDRIVPTMTLEEALRVIEKHKTSKDNVR